MTPIDTTCSEFHKMVFDLKTKICRSMRHTNLCRQSIENEVWSDIRKELFDPMYGEMVPLANKIREKINLFRDW
jgi:hypothetical protein